MAILLAGLATGWLLLATAQQSTAAELVMMEQEGCAWCLRWHRELGETYPKTDAGKKAPLRTVDINKPLPEDLKWLRAERFTPTFVLIDDGREIGRMRGYSGDEFFWFLLDEMIAKLDKPI